MRSRPVIRRYRCSTSEQRSPTQPSWHTRSVSFLSVQSEDQTGREFTSRTRCRHTDARTRRGSVDEEGLSGAEDPVVLDAALAAGRVLFTLDKGIADLRRYPSTQHAGVVLF